MSSIAYPRPLPSIDRGNIDEPILVQTQVCATLLKVADIASNCAKFPLTKRGQTEIKNLQEKHASFIKNVVTTTLLVDGKLNLALPQTKRFLVFLLAGFLRPANALLNEANNLHTKICIDLLLTHGK